MDTGYGTRLRADWGDGPGTTVAALQSGARFGFLSDEEGEFLWHPTWGANAAAPRAVGVFVAGDTLVYWLGPR
jgi:hypothetical protein